MITALLTAAGIGSRMGQDIPKQFLHVDNKPIIVYTLEVFQRDPNIDAIVVVTLESWVEVLRVYAKQFNITKLKTIVVGGETGQESIQNGIRAIIDFAGEDSTVLIHDGNRPWYRQKSLQILLQPLTNTVRLLRPFQLLKRCFRATIQS
jgi:2-C-methyl-D-erythritol 4-phosphate cytidylyltransferase